MTTYTRPLVNGTPTTGQVVKAGHVNEPIDQIYDTILAGGITADQIAVGAVDTSELATAAVTAAKMDGTLPDASAMATSAAPTLDKHLANKKYVDDQRFQNRGDPSSVDFAVGDLLTDGNWNDLNLSSIVSAGARAVLLKVAVQDNAVGSAIQFRRNGNSNIIAGGDVDTQVTNVLIRQMLTIPCDTNRVIEYLTSNLTFTTINITVIGWWN